MGIIDELTDRIVQRFREIQLGYVRKVAFQIRKIGRLSQVNINRLTVLSEVNADIVEVTSQLQRAADVSATELGAIFKQAEKEVYTDPRFSRVVHGGDLPQDAMDRLAHYSQTVAMQTAGRLTNLSNTTITSEVYQQAVDDAILASSMGLDSYQAAMRETVAALGGSGLQVEYPSGYRRRLDTAVRQNILTGVHQISQQGAKIIGDALEYDAVELSAHLMSAPDHEPVQGRVFTLEEFQKMQAGADCMDIDGHLFKGFKRPIGEWNCGHFPHPFSTQYSQRLYTDEQLEQMREDNAKGCEISGKHYSLYEASQLMRKLETQVRKQKDIAVAAQAAGDDALRKKCQERIRALAAEYVQVSEASGLSQQRERMRVIGFKPYKE